MDELARPIRRLTLASRAADAAGEGTSPGDLRPRSPSPQPEKEVPTGARTRRTDSAPPARQVLPGSLSPGDWYTRPAAAAYLTASPSSRSHDPQPIPSHGLRSQGTSGSIASRTGCPRVLEESGVEARSARYHGGVSRPKHERLMTVPGDGLRLSEM